MFSMQQFNGSLILASLWGFKAWEAWPKDDGSMPSSDAKPRALLTWLGLERLEWDHCLSLVPPGWI